MAFIIDGHNLIPKVAGLSLSHLDDEQELIHTLQSYCRERGCTLEVYFDQAAPGFAGSKQYGKVTAHFIQNNSNADQAITKRLKQLKRTAQNWIVVSSDRQVQAEARTAGAGVMSAEEFAHKLYDSGHHKHQSLLPAEKQNGLGEDEIEEWLRLFGNRE